MKLTDDPIHLARAEALDAWQPLERCLIACEVFHHYDRNPYLEGHLAPAREIWEQRTYEVYRVKKGDQGDGTCWCLDFGEGRPEYRQTWDDVVGWFKAMRPRNIEVLVDGGNS